MKIITRKACQVVLMLVVLIITACGNKKGESTPVSRTTTLEAVKNEPGEINSPAKAYKALVDGNQRYMNGQFIHVHIKRLNEEDDDGEQPFVALVTCPDFKIPAEILFDVDRDNIQLIRSNASLEDDSVITAITDAINNLQIHLVLVLGHHDCPALKKLLAGRFGENRVINKKIDSAIVYDPSIREPVYSKTAVNNVKLVAGRLARANTTIETAVKKSRIEIKPVFYNETYRKLVFTEGL